MRPLAFLAAGAFALAALGAQAQAPAPAAVQGNAEAGKNKVFQCQGCHGIPDWKTAFPEVYRVPKLGGQKPAYIVAALKEYKSGDREFPTMRAMTNNLSDQDMADIAAYYGAEQPQVAANTAGEAKK